MVADYISSSTKFRSNHASKPARGLHISESEPGISRKNTGNLDFQ